MRTAGIFHALVCLVKKNVPTGADYCIAGCHNCHAQIHELSEHHGGGYGVVHLGTIICLAPGVLGENEREYLHDDLKEVAVYGA